MPRWAMLVLLVIAIITFWLLWTSLAQALEQADIAKAELGSVKWLFERCDSLEWTPECHLDGIPIRYPGWLMIIQTRSALAGFLLLAALIAGLAWGLFRSHRGRRAPEEGDLT